MQHLAKIQVSIILFIFKFYVWTNFPLVSFNVHVPNIFCFCKV